MNYTYPLSITQEPLAGEPMRGQIDAIVRGAVLSLADCLRAPRVRTATVEADENGLAIRTAPFPDAPCTGHAPDGARLSVRGQCGAWYAVRYDGTEGFVSGKGIVLHY
nr:SH3 domain-containing protein [uncultured Agathobaculum sp.]